MLLLTGCMPYAIDITHDATRSAYWGDYHPGAQYRLANDVLITDKMVGEVDLTKYLQPWPPRYDLIPATADWPLRTQQIADIPAGTHLRFERLVYYWYFEDETTYPIARVLDGRFKGFEVCLQHISRQNPWNAKNPGDPSWHLRYFRDDNWLVEDDKLSSLSARPMMPSAKLEPAGHQ
jgi:hypothetical protein